MGNVRYSAGYKASNKRIADRPHIAKSGSRHNNYQHIYVYNNGSQVKRRVHRLVLSTFCPLHGNPENKMDADHIDFNQMNNKLSNLQWMERSTHNKRKKTNCKDYEFV